MYCLVVLVWESGECEPFTLPNFGDSLTAAWRALAMVPYLDRTSGRGTPAAVWVSHNLQTLEELADEEERWGVSILL